MSEPGKHYKERIKHDPQAAEDYVRRKPHKDKAEMDLVRRGFGLTDGVKSVLDAPCGVGRATILLASMGFDATGLDLGESAVEVARRELEKTQLYGEIVTGDLEDLAYDDDFFDAVLCFRVYHHFPNDEVRDRVITELRRVARKYVLISYFSPYSVTSLKRALRKRFTKKKSIQHATNLASIAARFERSGFRLKKNLPQFRFVHTLHLAIFERTN